MQDKRTKRRPSVCFFVSQFISCVSQGRPSHGWTKRDALWNFRGGDKNPGSANKYTNFGQLTTRKFIKIACHQTPRFKAETHQFRSWYNIQSSCPRVCVLDGVWQSMLVNAGTSIGDRAGFNPQSFQRWIVDDNAEALSCRRRTIAPHVAWLNSAWPIGRRPSGRPSSSLPTKQLRRHSSCRINVEWALIQQKTLAFKFRVDLYASSGSAAKIVANVLLISESEIQSARERYHIHLFRPNVYSIWSHTGSTENKIIKQWMKWNHLKTHKM